jgi:hypothetical protein
MICLFCRRDSAGSRSVEHIIPQSLGNLSHTLGLGVVCDQCNNYLARGVEKPFLDRASLTLLRFRQAIPSKRGRVPAVDGIITPGIPAIARRRAHCVESGLIDIEVPEDAIEYLKRVNGGQLIFPAHGDLPTGAIVSRFLAKVALEAMASRLVERPDGLNYVATQRQLDLLRNHARRGETRDWPFSSRRIYAENAKWLDEDGEMIQLVHEFDILRTDWNEWFFVLAIFGLELTINYGGPEIDGYHRWLKEHDHASPLY